MNLPRYNMMIIEPIHRKLYSSLDQVPYHIFLNL
ncbi:hypothetical protein F383_32651 [Gossypium arboreum]|uniref:Uncharacterized protein n=1 Tax=Gossypium arboreum TaxID=29729 RepID=A0A0B0PIM7_GOSAR|nr:hypothetical protein F383_32651 [Gossypium arboreum]